MNYPALGDEQNRAFQTQQFLIAFPAMNGIWFVVFSAALYSVLAYIVYRHYSKIGLMIVLLWFLPGLVYLWLTFLSLTAAAQVYGEFIGIIQVLALTVFALWFRSRYTIKIEPK